MGAGYMRVVEGRKKKDHPKGIKGTWVHGGFIKQKDVEPGL
jgi:hypothetical protein